MVRFNPDRARGRTAHPARAAQSASTWALPASPRSRTARSTPPLNSFKRHETALRKAQQTMSRKVKFSNNWKKAKARVQRIHSRIGNARRDYLHKTSTTISQNHAMVCIEDLQVRNMSKSAAGSTEQPGKKRSGQVRPEQGHPRSRLGRVPAANWTTSWRGTADISSPCRRSKHQPDLPVLRPCVDGQPADASPVRVRGVWFRRKRRSRRRDQYPYSLSQLPADRIKRIEFARPKFAYFYLKTHDSPLAFC